jgi:hypothetical protein
LKERRVIHEDIYNFLSLQDRGNHPRILDTPVDYLTDQRRQLLSDLNRGLHCFQPVKTLG